MDKAKTNDVPSSVLSPARAAQWKQSAGGAGQFRPSAARQRWAHAALSVKRSAAVVAIKYLEGSPGESCVAGSFIGWFTRARCGRGEGWAHQSGRVMLPWHSCVPVHAPLQKS